MSTEKASEEMTGRTQNWDASTTRDGAAATYRRHRQGILDGTVPRPQDPSRHYDARGLVRGPWSRLSP